MFKRFVGDKRGNFAIMFAFAMMPILGGIAMTLEYTNLSRNFASLQNATDAAALFAGRYYLNNSRTLPSTANFKGFVESNFEGQLDNATMVISGDDLVVTSKSTVPAFFFGNLAPSVFAQTANATIPINQAVDIEVAMVLDVTGSMAYAVSGDNKSKIDRLKTAAKNFVNTLNIEGPGNDNSVKFSVVPFAAHVNVGSEYRGEWWLNVPAAPIYQQVCNNVNQPYYQDYWGWVWVQRGRWGGYWEYQHITGWTDNWVQECSNQYTGEKPWKGCVGSRSGNYGFVDGDYNSRKIEALLNSPNDDYCPTAKIMPLTNNISTVKTKIDSLAADGGTYIAPGVMWGQRLLSPQAPFDQGKAIGAVAQGITQQKVMIVMTDGDNTISAGDTNTPYHDGGNGQNWSSAADTETKKACDTARAAGTVVYTIFFGEGAAANTKTMLTECAGSSTRFFNATDSQKLNDAFSDIAGKIMKLHLAS